jgi:GxxExxY protein
MSEKYKYWNITSKIIEVALEVHRLLGPGYQEIIYHNALCIALAEKNIQYLKEKEIQIFYKNNIIGIHKIDLVVENKIVVELKSVIGEIPDVFRAQVISYLKASDLEIALLVNFGNPSLDVKRLVRFHDYYSTKINRRKHGIKTD